MDNATIPANSAGDDNSNSFDPSVTNSPDQTAEKGPFVVETEHHATAAVLQKAAHAADFATNKAEEAAAFTSRKAEDALGYIGQKTEEASAAAGSRLRSLGESVRHGGPDSGMAGDASAAMADSLDKSGRFLEEESLKDMAEDITKLIRRNPIPAMLVGIVAGYLAGRAMAPRS